MSLKMSMDLGAWLPSEIGDGMDMEFGRLLASAEPTDAYVSSYLNGLQQQSPLPGVHPEQY